MTAPAHTAADLALAAAIARVEDYTYSATGQHGAHTTQTRRAVAIMRELGVPRSAYKAQTQVKAGVYGDCHVSLTTTDAARIVAAKAPLAAALGLSVTLYGDDGAVAKVDGNGGRVRDLREVSA